jgi:hypothetical protein
MGLIDAVMNRSFRQTPAGRVVVFSGDPRKCGYLVKSPAEEEKIRSFLRMFYFAHLYIVVFGVLLSQVLASWLSYRAFDRPAHHLLGSASLFVAIYGLLVGVPYAFLWRAYKRALRSFTAPADEVSLTGTTVPGGRWILLAMTALVLLTLAATLLLAVRPRVS